MLRRLLMQEDLKANAADSLEAKGIKSFKKMIQTSEWELAHMMDCSRTDIQVCTIFLIIR